MTLEEILLLCLDEGWDFEVEEYEGDSWDDDGFFMVTMGGAQQRVFIVLDVTRLIFVFYFSCKILQSVIYYKRSKK